MITEICVFKEHYGRIENYERKINNLKYLEHDKCWVTRTLIKNDIYLSAKFENSIKSAPFHWNNKVVVCFRSTGSDQELENILGQKHGTSSIKGTYFMYNLNLSLLNNTHNVLNTCWTFVILFLSFRFPFYIVSTMH